jgi:PilZ domain-containing protein
MNFTFSNVGIYRGGDYRTGWQAMTVGNLSAVQIPQYFISTSLPMILKRNFKPARRSPRQWLNTSVDVFSGPAHMDALGINLSEGGMGLFVIANLHVGSQIQVEFLPPLSKTRMRLSGVVRHRALYLYGIEFVGEPGEPTYATNQQASA